MSDLELHYEKVSEREDTVAFITLNRPECANALSFKMIENFSSFLKEIKEKKECRALVLRASGKHFSAGADLGWMKASKEMTREENYKDSLALSTLFERIYHLRVPTIAVVKGSSYGGALGLVAACDSVIATNEAQFCLSEVKMGLAPAVIYPYLARKIQLGVLKRLALTAEVFGTEYAQKIGLVNFSIPSHELSAKLKSELSLFLACAPHAQEEIKILHHKVITNSFKQSYDTVELISGLRVGEEAQHGLSSFFEKKKPLWALKLREDWNPHV